MTTVSRYGIYCITDGQIEYEWDTENLTACPVNSGHTIQAGSVTSYDSQCFANTETITSSTATIEFPKVYYCDTSSNNITITLPSISSNYINGYYFFKKTSPNNTLTIQGANTELIDGQNSVTVTNSTMITTSNGTSWYRNPENFSEPVQGASIAVSNPILLAGSTGPTGPIGLQGPTGPAGVAKYYKIMDQKSSGTQGGTAVAGSWYIRTLNTLESCPVGDSDVSLSSNEFTLQPGNWKITAYVPSFRTQSNQGRLYNVTDGSIEAYGISSYSYSWTDVNVEKSIISHIMTLSSAKTFRIEQRVSYSRGTNGLGRAVGYNGNNEVYTIVEINKF